MEYYKQKKILITGHTGFIGSHLFRKLRELGAIVSGADSKIDLTNQINTRDFFEAIKLPDIIFHLAANSAGIKEMKENPEQMTMQTARMLINTFEYAFKKGVKKFIYISSTTVSYRKDYLGIADVRIFGEALCEFYTKLGMQCTIIRPCNAYGPGDKFDDRAHFVPSLIKRAVNKESPFAVWGDGSNIRNLIYIDDLIEGIIEASQKEDLGSYTIGHSDLVSVGLVAGTILKLTEHNVPIIYDATKPNAVNLNIPNCNIIKNSIKLEEGLKRTIEWYRSIASESIKK